MPHSFHPFPVVGALKMLIMASILSLLLLIFTVLPAWLFTFLLLLIWAVTVLKMLMLIAAARYQEIILDDNTITYISGVISRNRLVLPYPRITEAGYTQGFLQRIFGVGTLKVDTAGGSKMAIYMQDVRYDDLTRILEKINRKSTGDEGE